MLSDQQHMAHVGIVVELRDGIATVTGLSHSFVGEIVAFGNADSSTKGFVWNLEANFCKIPLISGYAWQIRAGDNVYCTHKQISIRCGFGVLGEVLSPLGDYLAVSELSYAEYAHARLFKTSWCAIEVNAPGIVVRAPVTSPLMTGVASVDCFIPIGCGQRELIIGDQNTGKTSLAITAIINQSYRNNVICNDWDDVDWCSYKYPLFIPCVYVAIGSKRSEIVRLRQVLSGKEALKYTSLVFTSADDLAATQYLAPFAGCTIGEWFMNHGYDALIVYDALTQHAVAYRQMSLLLRRPPGREAYPGDIFYLHARLLERAGQLITGGSLTALPIIQTLGGDLSGYIPTNVISITDGQIFLVKSLINKGIRPAVDLTLSVSRTGSAAQYPAMAYVAKRVKIMYSMYRIYAGVAKLGSEDADVLLHVGRGERLFAFFTQAIYETYTFYKQVVCLFASTLESMDKVKPSKVHMFFTLMTLRQFKYLKGLAPHMVSYFTDARSIEALLMIYSFGVVEEDITIWVDHFSNFFVSEVQDKSMGEAGYLIIELFRRRTHGEIFRESDLW